MDIKDGRLSLTEFNFLQKEHECEKKKSCNLYRPSESSLESATALNEEGNVLTLQPCNLQNRYERNHASIEIRNRLKEKCIYWK
jgi:hypothetical protein